MICIRSQRRSPKYTRSPRADDRGYKSIWSHPVPRIICPSRLAWFSSLCLPLRLLSLRLSLDGDPVARPPRINLTHYYIFLYLPKTLKYADINIYCRCEPRLISLHSRTTIPVCYPESHFKYDDARVAVRPWGYTLCLSRCRHPLAPRSAATRPYQPEASPPVLQLALDAAPRRTVASLKRGRFMLSISIIYRIFFTIFCRILFRSSYIEKKMWNAFIITIVYSLFLFIKMVMKFIYLRMAS